MAVYQYVYYDTERYRYISLFHYLAQKFYCLTDTYETIRYSIKMWLSTNVVKCLGLPSQAMPFRVSYTTKQQCELYCKNTGKRKMHCRITRLKESKQTIRKFQGSKWCTEISLVFFQNTISLVFEGRTQLLKHYHTHFLLFSIGFAFFPKTWFWKQGAVFDFYRGERGWENTHSRFWIQNSRPWLGLELWIQNLCKLLNFKLTHIFTQHILTQQILTPSY